jgi:hypothetical protein
MDGSKQPNCRSLRAEVLAAANRSFRSIVGYRAVHTTSMVRRCQRHSWRTPAADMRPRFFNRRDDEPHCLYLVSAQLRQPSGAVLLLLSPQTKASASLAGTEPARGGPNGSVALNAKTREIRGSNAADRLESSVPSVISSLVS